MKRRMIIIGIVLAAAKLQGQDYQISFAGTGAATSVGYVKVENLFQGTSRIVKGSDQLLLKGTVTGPNQMQYTSGDRLKLTGITGNCRTVITDIPTSSKTITFYFVPSSDIEGNNYDVVKIGTQTWFAENLRTTSFKDGTPIPCITDAVVWSTLSTPGYCWYENDQTTFKATYGPHYNWYVVNTDKLCPAGWHVPSNAEWTDLKKYLKYNGFAYNGVIGCDSIAKAVASTIGIVPYGDPFSIGSNQSRNNSSGLSLLICGSVQRKIIVPGNTTACGNRRGGDFTCKGTHVDYWNRESGSFHIEYHSGWANLSLTGDKRAGYPVRCLKDTGGSAPAPTYLPSVITDSVINITQTTASSGGDVVLDGGYSITARGVCWSVSHFPKITDNKTNDGTGKGNYTSSLTGLTANTLYFVRAYATNSAGTVYGEEVSFTTNSTGGITGNIVFNPNLTYGSVSDIDGNTYKTISIGTQTWMAENLRTTRYNDGNAITSVTSAKYYTYNNTLNSDTIAVYGRLYNGYVAISSHNICPVGWHVPSDTEWTVLTNNFGENLAGDKMRETGTTHWINPGSGSTATNESGFTALPSGWRDDADGKFCNLGRNFIFLSRSQACESMDIYGRNVIYNFAGISRGNIRKTAGASIRCVLDTSVIVRILTVNSGTGSGSYSAGTKVSILANTPATGKIFDKWTGDIANVADVNASSTTITMPSADASVTATYKDAPANTYTLAVTNGTGNGNYTAGTVVTISANAPATGKVFDKWTGDITDVADVNASSTKITMPSANASVTATYKNVPANIYILTVTNGMGSGSYTAGTVVNISANAPATGKVFDKWTGNVSGINVNLSSTAITMPATNTVITATYKDAPNVIVENNNMISIYPNPVQNILSISGMGNKSLFSIYDMNGVLLIQKQEVDEQIQIDVSNLNVGIYIIKVSNQCGSLIGKFIKE